LRSWSALEEVVPGLWLLKVTVSILNQTTTIVVVSSIGAVGWWWRRSGRWCGTVVPRSSTVDGTDVTNVECLWYSGSVWCRSCGDGSGCQDQEGGRDRDEVELHD